MESRHVRRRSSQGSKEDEIPFMTTLDPEDKENPKEKAIRDGVRRTETESEDNYEVLLTDDEVLGHALIRGTSQSGASERMKWWKVYGLHFLFMWNTRTYEYASIVLISLAFPKTLFAASLRGITITVATMLCASAVGSWIDRSSTRLRPMLISVSSNHGAIVVSYLFWLLWPLGAGYETAGESSSHSPFSRPSEGLLFVLILMMDVVHDLGAMGNTLSLQRDWVPVLVGLTSSDSTYSLTQVNSVLARIDLSCKIVAPSLLPLIVSNFNSRAAWISLLLVVTLVLWALEIWCANVIAKENEQLRLPKKPSDDEATAEDLGIDQACQSINSGLNTWPEKLYFVVWKDPLVRLKHYFSMPVWPASISISILELSVLAYSATLVTYLLEVGYALSAVTIARGTGAAMALSGTFIVPFAANRLRKRYSQSQSTNEAETEGRVVRKIGLWGVSSQLCLFIPVVAVLWNLPPKSGTSPSEYTSDTTQPAPNFLLSIILFSFLSLTRIGHWMFYLMVQEIEQVEIHSSQRSTFAGTEQSFKGFFELCHWGATTIWSRPEEFRFLALGNLVTAGIGTALFAVWQRKRVTVGDPVKYEEIAMDDIEPARVVQDN